MTLKAATHITVGPVYHETEFDTIYVIGGQFIKALTPPDVGNLTVYTSNISNCIHSAKICSFDSIFI